MSLPKSWGTKTVVAAVIAMPVLWLGARSLLGWAARIGDRSSFMPHGYCYLWNPLILWLHVVSDGLIVLSYYCIPAALIYLARRRRDLPFNWIFWMFGLFIVGCGTTHLMEIWTVWHASYALAGVVKAITAAVSVATAIALAPLLPKAIALPSPDELRAVNQTLEGQIVERRQAERELKDTLTSREHALAALAEHKSAIEELRLAQTALDESQNQLTGIIQSAMDGIITVDEQQRVVIFNAAAERMFGCKYAEARGQSIERFIPQRFRGGHAGHIRRFSETGVTTRAMGTLGAIWGQRANGEEFPLEASISQAESGGKKLFTVILRDITERKRVEDNLSFQTEELSRQAEDLMRARDALSEQRQILELVLNSMGEGLVAADENGKFLIWNPAAEKILGRGPAIVPSGEWSAHYEVYQTDGVTPFPTAQLPLVQAMAGRECELELIVRNPKSGKKTWLETTAHPLRDTNGALRGGVVAFRDITQRKNDQREIHGLYEELERRVVQRTAELAETNKELEAFTYSVSHDLRAPLRHIGGFAKLLVEEFGPTLPAEAQHHLGRIQEGTRRMGQLVDELLSLARLGRQSLSQQTTELDSVVKEVVTLLEPETQQREVEWKIASLPLVECDPTLMQQVYQNLIANALKYSRPRAKAVIEIGHSEQKGRRVFFVRDNGVGFNMKFADKLFGVFQRLHRAEDFEGTGAGLATVQRIIQKHGGRVWAESELDKGSTFYFTLGGGAAKDAEGKGAAQGSQA